MAVTGFICQLCKQPAPSRGPRQKYCEPCSDQANIARGGHRPTKVRNSARSEALAERSIAVATEYGATIGDTIRPIKLNWVARVSVPFSWNASKNAIYSLRRAGHVAIRREARAWRDALISSVRAATKDIEIKQNKLWIDIFVQKSSHKGDAVNVVDMVCDAVKVAVGLDDRWFCIRRVDWEVVKHGGRVFVGVGQEDVDNAQICSGCGQSLPFSKFTRHKGNPNDIGRECIECRAISRPRRLKRRVSIKPAVPEPMEAA